MRLAIVAAGVLVIGCTHLPSQTDGLDRDSRQARLTSVAGWQMNGRLSIDTGERGYQARFRWRQVGERLTLTVSGPAGLGGFEIDGDAESLTLLYRRERRVLLDPEQDLSLNFGWWLPVTSLRSWLLGLPDDRFPSDDRRERSGTLAGLDQRLWRVDYNEYQLANEVLIPRSMHLSHESLELDLTIDRWQPLAPSQDTLN
jgi:outer membrane lipoprotein LolB